MNSLKNLLKIINSVLASFFGVQGNKKYDEDNDYLEKNGFTPFLIVGIFLVIIFFACTIVCQTINFEKIYYFGDYWSKISRCNSIVRIFM